MVTFIHTLHNNFMLQMRYLLFNLVAAVSRCRINNQLLFLCHMSNKLPFELSFFCFIAPRNTFIEIWGSEKWRSYCSSFFCENFVHLPYTGIAQSLLQPYSEFLSCEHHPDTLTHPNILAFKWVKIYRYWILVPVHSLVWLTVTMFCTECYNAA